MILTIIGTIIMTLVLLAIIGIALFFIGKSTTGITGAAALFLLWLIVMLNNVLRPGTTLPMPERMKQAIKPHVGEEGGNNGQL